MIRYIRDLRLIPIALIASACLLVLKTADLALNGGHWLAGDDTPTATEVSVRTSADAPQPPGMKLSWAQQMFGFPSASGASEEAATSADIVPPRADKPNLDITGSITTTPGDGKTGNAAPPGPGANTVKSPQTVPASGSVIPTEGYALPSNAERAILERLQQRREDLDKRARELDIRESLIKEAEKRMDGRLAELKEVEARIATETQQKNDAEAARLKGLVTMYENMKPRDAAKIFDRLETDVLIEVSSQINPRKMSDILAQMSPDSAERLTVELASRAQQANKNGPPELPKIEGQPASP